MCCNLLHRRLTVVVAAGRVNSSVRPPVNFGEPVFFESQTKLPWSRALLLVGALLPASCAHIDGNASKREAVERGLLPAIVISVQPAHSCHINERMARYHVPGVKIGRAHV